MNAAEAFRLRFQSLLARGLATSEIAATVGLAAASEVWGGDRPRERPAWYLWLRGRPGAWQVELAGAGALGPPSGGAALAARFTVRHYPSPGSGELAGFSAEERRVAGVAFDATGTPRVELASGIPGALFVVGTVDWALDLERDAAVFALASLDRLRARTRTGELVRDVPGWQLAAPVFALLAGLHAQVERRAARRMRVSRQPGFEVVEDGGPRHRDAPERAHGEAFLVFPGAPAHVDAEGSLLGALQDGDGEVVADLALDPGMCGGVGSGDDPRLPMPVSHAWFGGRAHVQDRGMCAC